MIEREYLDTPHFGSLFYTYIYALLSSPNLFTCDVIYKFNSIHKQRKNVHVCYRIILYFIRNNNSIYCVVHDWMCACANVYVCLSFRYSTWILSLCISACCIEKTMQPSFRNIQSIHQWPSSAIHLFKWLQLQ